MKTHYTHTFIIACCIIGLLSSCVSISKIRYLEAVGDNKNDWEIKKTPDVYYRGFYDLSLTKNPKDNMWGNSATVNFDFHFNASYLWFWNYPGFNIEISGDNFLKQIYRDNLSLKTKSEPVNKISIDQVQKPSYKKPNAYLVGDSLLIIEGLSQYLKNPSSNLSLYVRFRLRKGKKLKIVTGNTSLDSLFNQNRFSVKTKTRLGWGRLGAMMGH